MAKNFKPDELNLQKWECFFCFDKILKLKSLPSSELLKHRGGIGTLDLLHCFRMRLKNIQIQAVFTDPIKLAFLVLDCCVQINFQACSHYFIPVIHNYIYLVLFRFFGIHDFSYVILNPFDPAGSTQSLSCDTLCS